MNSRSAASAVRLADDVRMQTDIHDTAADCAFAVKLIEAELEHVDAVAGGEPAAGEHVEVVDVVGIRHTHDRAVDGIDQIRLIVVEIIAIGDDAEFLKERRRVLVPRIADDSQAFAGLPTTFSYSRACGG